VCIACALSCILAADRFEVLRVDSSSVVSSYSFSFHKFLFCAVDEWLWLEMSVPSSIKVLDNSWVITVVNKCHM
jgi:hypothetical protein